MQSQYLLVQGPFEEASFLHNTVQYQCNNYHFYLVT